MSELLTANRVHAHEVPRGDPEMLEAAEFVERHGFPLGQLDVFQAEVDIADCPAVRFWWRPEILETGIRG